MSPGGAGVEGITSEGRAYLDKDCRPFRPTISRNGCRGGKRHVPFVQGNLIGVAAPMSLRM